MYRDAVKYKEFGWLAPGSDAMELYKSKKWKELDNHCRELERKSKELEERYD